MLRWHFKGIHESRAPGAVPYTVPALDPPTPCLVRLSITDIAQEDLFDSWQLAVAADYILRECFVKQQMDGRLRVGPKQIIGIAITSGEHAAATGNDTHADSAELKVQ